MLTLLRNVAIVGVFCLAVVGGAQLLLARSDLARYRARIQAIRDAGDPLELADLARPALPDGQNAGPMLAEANAWLNQHGWHSKCLRFHGDQEDRAKWTPEEWRRFREYLQSLEPYYEMLELAASRPAWRTEVDWEKGPGRLHPSASAAPAIVLGNARRYLALRVELDSRDEGRTERAAKALLLQLRLAELYEGPFAFGYLWRLGFCGWTPLRLLELARARPGFDARIFRRLVGAALARAIPATGPPARVLKEERLVGLWQVRTWLSGETIGLVSRDGERREDRLRASWLGRRRVYRDAVDYLDAIERALAVCDQPPEESARLAAELSVPDRGREYLLTTWLERFIPTLLRQYVLAAAHNRFTRVALALLEYRQSHGVWPEALPDGLPRNPFTRQPFAYTRTGEVARLRCAEIEADWLLE